MTPRFFIGGSIRVERSSKANAKAKAFSFEQERTIAGDEPKDGAGDCGVLRGDVFVGGF